MVTNGDPNRSDLVKVARAFGDLRSEVVFLGGAVVGLLLTDRAAPRVRPTNDIDVVVAVEGAIAYRTVLRERLIALGFREFICDVTCRWKLDGVLVDIMSADEECLGFTNRWYSGALETATDHALEDIVIKLIAPAYFIATKIEAFNDRGRSDFALSHDLEDILAVVNARAEIVDEVASAPSDVRAFVADEIAALLASPAFMNVMPGLVENDRDEIVATRLRRICGS